MNATPATSAAPRLVDPRQPRLGQALTGTALGLGFVLSWEPVIPAMAAVLALASLGPRVSPYGYLFRWAARAFRLGPPRELEEAAPPRFSNVVGFVVTATATAAHYALGAASVAWALAVVVSALALLAAITGLCVGCELYVLARRVATRGRVPRRLTVPTGGTGARA